METIDMSLDWLGLAEKAANAGFWNWDIHTGKLTWSTGLYKLFAIPPEILPSFEVWQEKLHPDDRESAMAKIEQSVARATPLENEYRIVLPGGQSRWIHAAGNTSYNDEGQPLRMCGICIDITSRKCSEIALEKTALTTDALLNAADESIWLFGLDGTILSANTTACNRLGVTMDKAVGARWADLIPEHLVQSRQARIQEVVRTGSAVRFEDERAGITFDHSFYPVRDQAGTITAVAAFSRDITKRKEKEQELFKLNRTLRALSNVDQALIHASDEADYLNAICRIIVEDCGYSMVWIGFAEQDKEKSVRPVSHAGFEKGYLETLGITWADSERGRGPTGAAIRTRKPQMCRNMSVDPLFKPWREDALKRGYASSLVLPLLTDAKALGALTIYSRQIDPFSPDEINLLSELANHVTHGLAAIKLKSYKAKADEALRKARDTLEAHVQERTAELWKAYEEIKAETEIRRTLEDKLRQSQKMEAIGTLAGGIAHDFNNILAGVIGFTEMAIEDLPPDSATHHRLSLVLKAGKRAKDLVKQILTFSRQTEQEMKEVAVRDIIHEALGLLRPALPSTIEIRTNITAARDTVLADPVQLHQVIMNLCTNAAHAMKNKRGYLEIALTNTDIPEQHPLEMAPGPYVRISVSDTGCGMTKDMMERIFDPFFTTKGPGEGTGLGLSVVHGIVTQHKGWITVSSKPDEGTTLDVYLPRIERSPSSDMTTPKTGKGGEERILFVDDEEMLVEMNHQRLEKLGYIVTSSTSSLQALDIFKANPHQFDLVITDYTMPHMTGLELANELLKIQPNLPVILCSGLHEIIASPPHAQNQIRAFIPKTATKKELAEIVRNVLNARQIPDSKLFPDKKPHTS